MQDMIAWENIEIRRYQNDLYAMKRRAPFDAQISFAWDTKRDLKIIGIGTLRTKWLIEKKFVLPKNKKVTVKFRTGGERCRLINRKGTRSLKKLLQEWKIPPWERNRIPLIFVGDKLAAIFGYAVCEGFYKK